MSKPVKSQNNSDTLSILQSEMCDVVYRYLYILMKSLLRYELEISLEKNTIISFSIDSDFSVKCFYVYIKEGNNSRKYLSDINFSNKVLKCAVLNFILGRKEYDNCRPEMYAKWFENLKTRMQDLLNEQKKYEDIIDGIRNVPIFTPKREVLIEKK